MTNNFLALGLVLGLAWLFANASFPEGTPRPATPRTATAELAMPTNTVVPRGVVEARQAPVPLVRNTPMAVLPASDAPAPETKAQVPAEIERSAAKMAVEVDGYKNVSVLGRTGSGAWRAKGYRGTTEVLLTVDGTGRVTMD